MLSDLLASVAEGGKVLVSEDDYLLARIRMDDRELLAEVSRGDSGGIRPGGWPHVPGVLLPDSEIQPGDDQETRILLFSLPEDGELLLEKLSRMGGCSEEEAVSLGIQILEILKSLHAEGCRTGYIGPETVILDGDGRPLLLGGARGVPDSPFSPPEAVGRRPDDPRSDIFALGLMMIRSLAGSDERQRQVDAWNGLSEPLLSLLENMVQTEVGERFTNFTALSAGIRSMRSTPPGDSGSEWVTSRSATAGRMNPIWYVVITVAAALAVYLVISFSDRGVTDDGSAPPDSTGQSFQDSLITDPPDSSAQEIIVPLDIETVSTDPVIWISNGTGRPGAASEFREGPAAAWSSVYKCTASPRRSSMLLVRREDPRAGTDHGSRFFQVAEQLAEADSSLTAFPVDVTILLGADLVNDIVPAGAVEYSASPAGTLYVDIANNGVGGVFGGAGAATWTRSVLNGSCLDIDGEQWLLSVVDFRDGDILNAELGIPTVLDSTLFLYRDGDGLLRSAERGIRYTILEDSVLTESTNISPAPPDIWILLGS